MKMVSTSKAMIRAVECEQLSGSPAGSPRSGGITDPPGVVTRSEDIGHRYVQCERKLCLFQITSCHSKLSVESFDVDSPKAKIKKKMRRRRLSSSSSSDEESTQVSAQHSELELERVVVSNLLNLKKYVFEYDDSDEIFIVDEVVVSVVPFTKVDEMEMRIFSKLVRYFNEELDDKLVSLFEPGAKISLPHCHAMPESIFTALQDNINKFERLEGVFIDEEKRPRYLLLEISKKKEGRRKSNSNASISFKDQRSAKCTSAVCELEFSSSFLISKLSLYHN